MKNGWYQNEFDELCHCDRTAIWATCGKHDEPDILSCAFAYCQRCEKETLADCEENKNG